jgi:type IV pilus assembly protein PilQ
MIAVKTPYRSLSSLARAALRHCALICLSAACSFALAQENSIESISANQQGSNVVVKIALKNPVAKPPIGFAITSPARIALDFSDRQVDPGNRSRRCT